MQICLLTKRKIGNWHIYGQAYHLMLRTAMTNYTHLWRGLAAGCHSKKHIKRVLHPASSHLQLELKLATSICKYLVHVSTAFKEKTSQMSTKQSTQLISVETSNDYIAGNGSF